MRFTALAALALLAAPAAAEAKTCKLTPKQVVTQFLHEFYIEKKVRSSFEKWVDPGYIQHNPYAQTGREAAIAFLSKFVEDNPGQRTRIHRIIADGMEIVRRNRDIILGSWCGKKFRPEKVAARPGWAEVPAVRDGRLHEIKSCDILQPGPAALTDGLAQLQRLIALTAQTMAQA